MKINQKGFTVVEGLLMVVILAIIGGTGWYVMHSKDQTDRALTSATKTSTGANSSAVAQKTLTIKEWGVRMKLLPGYSELYYSIIKTDGSQCDDNLCAVGFSDRSIASANSACDAESGLFGYIYRAKPGTKIGPASDIIDTLPGAKVVAGYVYYYEHPQGEGPCSEIQATKDLNTKLKKLGTTGSIGDMLQTLVTI